MSYQNPPNPPKLTPAQEAARIRERANADQLKQGRWLPAGSADASQPAADDDDGEIVGIADGSLYNGPPLPPADSAE